MTSLPQLIRKYGSADKIPQDVLEMEGLARYKGKVVYIETLSPSQLADALGVEELQEETDERKLEHKVTDAKSRITHAFRGPIGQCMAEPLRKAILEGVDLWVEYMCDTHIETFKTLDDLKISMIPHVQFVEAANQFLKNSSLNPAYASEVLEYAFENFSDGRLFDDPLITTSYFVGAENEYILSREKSIKSEVWSNENLKEEFRKKYGDPDLCSGGPFISWAFRKRVLNEENPPEFWGKELFELHKRLIVELGDSEAVRKFADLVYSEECQYAGERVFNFREERGLHGLKAISNGLPRVVESFEQSRKNRGAAIAFIETEDYHIDTDYLSSTPSIRELLKTVHEVEFGAVKENPLEHYEFLDKFVKSPSKKLKIARLCNQSSDFMKLVHAYCQGNGSYVDSLEGNILIGRELQDLGIKVDTFYRGIEPREFVATNGKIINRQQLRQEQLSLYRQIMQTVFRTDIVHGTDRLEQKIADAFKENEKFSPIAEQPISEYIAAVEDDEVVRKVCNVTAEYLSRKQNVKESQQAAATVHHLKTISKFMRGEPVGEVTGEESNVYRIKVASKNPFIDVDIGNDGGCCIGIYGYGDFERDEWTPEYFISYLHRSGGKELEAVEENGCYMPFYLKDRATQFVEIYKGQDRSGMALLFAGKNERNQPLLLVNSIELSDRLKQDSNKEMVVQEVIKFVKEYAHASGFAYVLMGTHNYNPAREFATGAVDFNAVNKVHCWEEGFYSDVLGEDGEGDSDKFRIV